MVELASRSAAGGSARAVVDGVGPALLVIHPGGNDLSSWDSVTAMLADSFTIARLRRRIYEPDATAGPEHTIAVETADVLALARELPRPLTVVGHSSGAVVALEAALQAPGVFAKVIAYEPPIPTRTLPGGEANRRARAALDAGDPMAAMWIHFRDIVRLPARAVDYMSTDPGARAHAVRFAAGQLADTDAIDKLGTGIERYARLPVPTVLIQGEQSPDHLRERTAELAVVLPHAVLVTLEGQGHVANLTAPDVLARAIRAAAEPMVTA